MKVDEAVGTLQVRTGKSGSDLKCWLRWAENAPAAAAPRMHPRHQHHNEIFETRQISNYSTYNLADTHLIM